MFTVVGFKCIVSKKDSTKYVELHCLSEDRYINGSRCDTFFVRYDMIDNVELLDVGCLAQILFNRYGRPDRVVLSV